MSIGQRMRDKRLELNIQPKDIAEKIGKSVSTYYRYETGEIEKLTISKMCEIAEILNVSPIYLLLGLEADNENETSEKTDINNRNIISFASKLKDLMTANRLSYEELSEELSNGYKIKVNADDIRSWEDGIHSPDVASVIAISQYFKISIDFLIGNAPSFTLKKNYTPKAKEPGLEYNKESFIVKNTSRLLKNSEFSLEEISEKTGIPVDKLNSYVLKEAYVIEPMHIKLISDALGVPYLDMMYERNAGPIIEKLSVLNAIQLDRVEEFIDKLLTD